MRHGDGKEHKQRWLPPRVRGELHGSKMLNLETVNPCKGTQVLHTLVLGQARTGLDAFR
jgi:hypothetical protein